MGAAGRGDGEGVLLAGESREVHLQGDGWRRGPRRTPRGPSRGALCPVGDGGQARASCDGGRGGVPASGCASAC